VTQLLCAKIRTDGGTQQREKTRQDVVHDYAEAIDAGCVFAPVVVFKDGEGRLWLVSGFHRLAAHVLARCKYIAADIRSGSLRDAILDSVGCNHEHGLQRTPGDKRKAVTTLLADPEWARWNNSEIARRCKVGEKLVRALRHDLSSAEPKMQPTLVTRGPSTYPMQPRGRKALAGLAPAAQARAVIAADLAALRPRAIEEAGRHLAAVLEVLDPYPDLAAVTALVARARQQLLPAEAAA